MIQINDLSKTYESEEVKTYALRGVTLEIGKGEFISIMGPSGSGKSTLMQLLGFLDRPTGGTYFFEGEDTSKFDDDELAHIRNKKVGFVFQTFNLLPRTTVFENVELPLIYDHSQKGRSGNQERVKKALGLVGLEHRAGYFSNQLSGGEKQRVAIARALVNEPDIIFADEPTGNLDSKSGTQIMKILQQLNDLGHTVILVTHEQFTARHGKRLVRVMDGEVVSDEIITNRILASDGELVK